MGALFGVRLAAGGDGEIAHFLIFIVDAFGRRAARHAEGNGPAVGIQEVGRPGRDSHGQLARAIIGQMGDRLARLQFQGNAHLGQIGLNLSGQGFSGQAARECAGGEDHLHRETIRITGVGQELFGFVGIVRIAQVGVRSQEPYRDDGGQADGGTAHQLIDDTVVVDGVGHSLTHLFVRQGFGDVGAGGHGQIDHVHGVALDDASARILEIFDGVDIHVLSDVDVSPANHHALGGRVGDVFDDDFVQLGGLAPVVRVFLQGDVHIPRPALENVGTRACGVLVQPFGSRVFRVSVLVRGAAMRHHRFRVNDGEVGRDEHGQEGGVGLLQGDGYRVVIDDVDFVHHVHQPGGIVLQVAQTLEGEFHVRGRERIAAVELDVIPQGERVDETVIGDLPAFGQEGHDFGVVCAFEGDQVLVHRVHDHRRRQLVLAFRIERADVEDAGDDQGFATLGRGHLGGLFLLGGPRGRSLSRLFRGRGRRGAPSQDERPDHQGQKKCKPSARREHVLHLLLG